MSADVPHKSDIGGVIVGIESDPALRSAYRRILVAVATQPGECVFDGILVAKMVRGGIELVLGMFHDQEMGPVILFGVGGVDIELTRDVALAAPPLDAARANELISRTRVGRILDGYRGQTPKDRAALVRALIGFSHLVSDVGSQIDSIDINPFMLLETEGVALDALVILKFQTRVMNHRLKEA